jgi:hypothetical protein
MVFLLIASGHKDSVYGGKTLKSNATVNPVVGGRGTSSSLMQVNAGRC